MNDIYVAGFMDKCAAAGVDPEALVKWAAGTNTSFVTSIPDETPAVPKKSITPKKKPTREQLSGQAAINKVHAGGDKGLNLGTWQ